MKIPFPTKGPHVALCASLTVLLAACGNSAPSESDAKHAVQAELGDCTYVSMSDFNRLNGIDQGGGRYQVEIQYTLTLEANSDQKDKLEKIVDAYKQRMDLVTQMNQMRGKVPNWASDPTYQDMDQKQKALFEQLNSSYGERAFAQEFEQACPSFPSRVFNQLQSKVDGPAFTGKNSLQFHDTLNMVKTDNGWQEDR